MSTLRQPLHVADESATELPSMRDQVSTENAAQTPMFGQMPSHHSLSSRNMGCWQRFCNLSILCPCKPCKNRPRVACGCCVAMVVFFVSMPLLMLLVAPSIATHIAAGATIRVDVFHMSKMQENSFEGHVKLLVRLPQPAFSPKCSLAAATLAMSYDFGDGPGNLIGMREIGTLISPPLSLGAETNLEVTNNFTITDVSAMGEFMLRLMNSHKPVVAKIKGMPEASFMGHSLGKIPMNVDVALWGMAPLKQFKIDSLTFPGSDSQGVQINTTVALSNPTGAGFSGLGIIRVEVRTKGYSLGNIIVRQLAITPGRIEVSALGHLKCENASVATPIFTDWLSNTAAIVDFQAYGEDAMPSWVKAGLSGLQGMVALPPYTGPPLIGGAELLKVNFSIAADASVRTSAMLSAHLNTPFGFPFEVLKLWGPLNLLDQEGQRVALLDLPAVVPEWIPNASRKGSGILTASSPETSVVVLDQTKLGAQLGTFLGPSSKMIANGTVQATLKSAMGIITVGVPTYVETTVSPALNGMHGMRIPDVDLAGGTPESLELKSLSTVPNPSAVLSSRIVPCLPTIISYRGDDVGTAQACNTLLVPNQTTGEWVTCFMHGNHAAVAVIQDYLNGKDVDLDIRGDPGSVEGPAKQLLIPIAKAFKTTVTMEGLKTPLMVRAQMLMSGYSVLHQVVPVQLVVNNPWTAGFQVIGVDAHIYIKASESQAYTILLGFISNLDLSKDPLVVRSRASNQPLTPVPVSLAISSCVHGNLRSCMHDMHSIFSNGSAPVKIDARLMIRIGSGFTMTIEYIQEDVPVSITWKMNANSLSAESKESDYPIDDPKSS